MIHLFDAWGPVAKQLRHAERLLLMLDFDGTLAPIVPRPADARIPAETLTALGDLQARPTVTLALISGRGVHDVRNLAGLGDIHYFGSHGRERLRPGSGKAEADQRDRADLENLCRRLDDELAAVQGFEIENKGVAAAAHFRNVEPGQHGLVEQAVRRETARAGQLVVSRGKMVFDITPLDGIDKGVAALTLLTEVGGLPLYFGDDATDESAFQALPAMAVTVYVGPPDGRSAARYRLANPDEVREALRRIARAVRR